MAKQTKVLLIDDIDGSEASKTVEYSVGGTTYAIDLSEENFAKFDEALAPFVAKSRKIGRAKKNAASVPAPSGRTREIREWARANGHEVSDRGRIPFEIVAAFEAAN